MSTVVVALDRILSYTLDQLGFPAFHSVTNVEKGMFTVTVTFMSRKTDEKTFYNLGKSDPSESQAQALWNACKKALDVLKKEHNLVYLDFSMIEIERIEYKIKGLVNSQEVDILREKVRDAQLAQIVRDGCKEGLDVVDRIMKANGDRN